MAILEHEVRAAAGSSDMGVRRHPLTRDAYRRLVDAGVFDDSRVELIEGEIIAMAPVGDEHSSATHPIAVLLERAFGPGFCARNQAPIALGEDAVPSEPQPDVAVVTGAWHDYRSRKPSPEDVRLIVEIADTSLTFDRTIKAGLYAQAGIPEYWIVNLRARQVEVYRQPQAAAYGETFTRKPGESVEPLLAPGNPIAVSDFLR